MRVYIFQTRVASGSSLASCSGSVSGSGEALRSGDPEAQGEVYVLVIVGERGGFCREKSSSEKRSVSRVDFELEEDVCVWESNRVKGGRSRTAGVDK